ncbi:MAG TPA: hypothetical protein VFG59_17235 [Anaeromyxobacter sp.]|nr:hypothetical protein [Anaeromyxobacter sp.]
MKILVAALSLALATPALAEKTEGVIPGVLIGPKLGLVSFPTPTVGVEAKLWRVLGLSFDYGLVPDFKLKDVTVGWTNWAAGARLFPFRGSFFVGALYGERSLTLKERDKSTGLKASARLNSTYLAPELGWRSLWNSGFFMGLDLGWQFVTHKKERLTIPSGYDVDKEKDVHRDADRVAKAGIPVLGLLQIGWYF